MSIITYQVKKNPTLKIVMGIRYNQNTIIKRWLFLIYRCSIKSILLILSYILLSILSKTEQNMISVNKYFKLLSKCNNSLPKTLCNLIQKNIDLFRVINVILILLYDKLTWYEEIHKYSFFILNEWKPDTFTKYECFL